ncbi:MAG: alcohol dehydrogenase catalytic domain-containing protein [Kiritimatiellaeota bacterium]|nr:alcohol dehydrogenase catalytic domain-containing protein [Kiritimatiellota bacterium]
MATQRVIGAVDGTGHGCVLTQDLPPPGEGEVLVKVHASLISPGTELSGAKKARANAGGQPGIPRPFGYQNAGEVLEAGSGVTEFKPGDRVACMGGGYAQHANYAVVPKNLCAHLPDNVTYEQGAYAHLAMTSLNAIRRGQPELGEYLVVVGLGLVGQMAARIGQIAGMYVMGWDMVRFRCEAARNWGIDGVTVIGEEDYEAKAKEFTRGYGFDMAVVAFGGEGTKALDALRKVMKVTPDTHLVGRICLVGGVTTQCAWGAGLGNLDLRSCARTGPGYHDVPWEHGKVEYPRVFMRWTTRTNMDFVLRLMSEKRLDVESLTTHRLPLERIDEAVTAHIEHPDQTLGTVLLMSHEG